MFRLRQAGGLPALNELTLTGYRLHRDTAVNIGRIANLQELYLSDSWVADADMQQLESLGELRSLNLVGTDVTPAGLDLIAKLPHLKKLELGGSLVHLDQTIRKTFPAQVEIEPLLVPGRSVLDNIAESLAAARQGNSLALWDQWYAGGSLDDNDLAVFDEFRGIQALNLWGAHLTDAGLQALPTLAKLRALNLAETHVSDRGFWHLRSLKSGCRSAWRLASTAVDGSGLRTRVGQPGASQSTRSGRKRNHRRRFGQFEISAASRSAAAGGNADHRCRAGRLPEAARAICRRLDLSNTKITAAGLARPFASYSPLLLLAR